jgi:type IV pilus assembly protein PilA
MAMQPMHPQQPPEKKGMSTCLIVAIVLAVTAVPVVGVMAALGIYGFRRYLSAAKSAEAKNTVGAIARHALSAYERETLVAGVPKHQACASAPPVPAAIPKGLKYMPSSSPGRDFESGSATEGWRCLKFSMSTPFYYQYHYRYGAPWVAPSNAPPGDGFEAAAKGDLDGNGVTSTFSRTATVSGGSVMLSTQLFIENEFE